MKKRGVRLNCERRSNWKKKIYAYLECNYCKQVIKGGVTRLKQHLAQTRKDIKPCLEVPKEVNDEFVEHLKQKKKLSKHATCPWASTANGEEARYMVLKVTCFWASASYVIFKTTKALVELLRVESFSSSSEFFFSKSFTLLPLKPLAFFVSWVSSSLPLALSSDLNPV
ncbi:hypothetical protein F8388_018771 [Cannabis sativa]|uniref:BED-type domain-containing protein n=1 Tax=Cannabis sativa TaxID=3483 RepID=A0A7J6GPL7_CANSA|nr:hypothetical protein F8388_018771 [Cannabis sativa]